ncbi:MAG: hypothetical protein WC710_13570 [Gallionella sp.]
MKFPEPNPDAAPYTREELAKLFEEAADDATETMVAISMDNENKWIDRAAALRGGEINV